MEKKLIFAGFLMVLLVLSLVNVSAITGKIGNGRMIINLEVGDILNRTIRVINDNDAALNITLTGSGDLVDYLEIIDDSFILQAGEEKKARFKLEAKKAGTYTTKINVRFAPLEEGGNGVGLSSTIITKIYKDGELPDNSDDYTDDGEITGDVVDGKTNGENSETDKDNKFLIVLVLLTILLVIVLIALISYMNSVVNRQKEKNNKKNKKERVEEIKKAAGKE